jgi:hypothetical protein
MTNFEITIRTTSIPLSLFKCIKSTKVYSCMDLSLSSFFKIALTIILETVYS